MREVLDDWRSELDLHGIALATSLVAVIRLLVLRLHVEDTLGGAHLPAPACSRDR